MPSVSKLETGVCEWTPDTELFAHIVKGLADLRQWNPVLAADGRKNVGLDEVQEGQPLPGLAVEPNHGPEATILAGVVIRLPLEPRGERARWDVEIMGGFGE